MSTAEPKFVVGQKVRLSTLGKERLAVPSGPDDMWPPRDADLEFVVERVVTDAAGGYVNRWGELQMHWYAGPYTTDSVHPINRDGNESGIWEQYLELAE